MTPTKLRWSSLFSLTSILAIAAVCSAGCGGGSSGDDSDDTASDSGGGGAKDSGGGDGSDATVTPPSDGATGTDSGGGGGGGDAAMEAGPACTMNSMCTSRICAPTGTCAAPSCTDGAENGDETDIDCGGSCAPCDSLKGCATGADCTSGVCNTDRVSAGDAGADGGARNDAGAADAGDSGATLECQAPTNTDGVHNGNETGVDCGGMGNPPCPDGSACGVRSDCKSDVCTNDVCIAPVCDDGFQNGSETDVDCGGPACPRCADGQMCKVPDDCHDSVCSAAKAGATLTCAAPTYTDMVQNGQETDKDCGGDGTVAHACPAGDKCLVSADCTSDGCDYTKHCAIHRSCTGIYSGGRYGADTCGRGGAGGVGVADWESCCTTVDISVKEGTMTNAQTMHLDKYKVTAGRMRAFLESQSGDIRDFVQQQRALGNIPALPITNADPAGMTVLDPSWDQYLPTSMDGDANEAKDCDQSGWNGTTDQCDPTKYPQNPPYSPIYTAAKYHVGPTVWKANSQTEQGCEYGLPGTHTYYLGSPDYEGQTPDFGQSEYDVKPVQCVDYLTAQAFCLWDGGRLETTQEWYAAWGAAAMPWTADTTDKDSLGNPFSTLKPHSDYVATYPSSQPCTTTDVNSPIYFANVCNGGTTYDANGNPVLHPTVCPTATNVCTPAPTYTACRFPSANDSTITQQNRGCLKYTQPPAGESIELADWQSSYESPPLVNLDFAVFIAAPGRTLGRAPNDLNNKEGAADILGDLFEVSSNVSGVNTKNAGGTAIVNYDPFPTTANPNVPLVAWSGNGSWEVHNYNHNLGGNGSYRILDKYGKMGLRCIHPTAN